MTRKLKLNPDIAYMLGAYSYSKGAGAVIGIVTRKNDAIERFTKTAVTELGIAPNKILIEDAEGEIKAYFYDSKLKKLFDSALEKKERLFKYKNAYSASYLAGIFDTRGEKDGSAIYIRKLSMSDEMLMERLGFHTKAKGVKIYIVDAKLFISFINRKDAK
ncbi:MAG: hypothetical protein M1504_02070 [Candidatus Marsarchaeota archaeon]|nr:hypothetical protein [Candidatus Marsarchaeota archaeon]